VLEVPRGDTNKHNVARAVEAQFEVKVANVNVTNIARQGQARHQLVRQTVNAKRMPKAGATDLRKAYVTLAEGHSLPFFECC
jgi:ribosomal protein L23